MVDLIDEQNRFLAGSAGPIGRACDHAAHFSDVALNPAQPNKLCVRHISDDVGERCFSGARRAGLNHRGQTIGFDGAAQ